VETKESAIAAIETLIEGEVHSPHDAAEIASNIFALLSRFGAEDPEVRQLASKFVARLSEWGLEDLLEQRVEYAMRLADSAGDLEFEEMHKLLSLCDDVFELESIGLRLTPALRRAYENAVRDRFRRQPNVAHFSAQHRTHGHTDQWWYTEALHGSKRDVH